MTEYFEVHDRDGPARLATLRLSDPVTAPALVDDVLDDAGSLWSRDRDPPSGDPGRLTVLPHRAFPAGTDDRVAEAFAVDYPDVDYPSVAVISETTADDHGADAYALSTAPGRVGHASAFVDSVLSVRRSIPDDAALYCSGVATPRNVATLVYAGVDLFDADRAVVEGRKGRYLTVDDDHFLSDLRELPCPCPACQTSVEAFDREDCVEHNVAALRAALGTVRERVRAGRLRDYVEGQARHANWLTATIRELDDEWSYVERRAPVFRDAQLSAATEDSLRRPEIRRFADRVTTRYRGRFDAPLVLVPCSATKPYSESQSHRQFRRAIDYRGHVVSMTSPIGVVPQELELTYPAQHYDTVVTGRWSAEEVEFVAQVLTRYLDRVSYSRVVAHVPAKGYREVIEAAFDRLDGAGDGTDPEVLVEFTVTDHPTTDESLAALSTALDGEERYRKRERQHNTVRAMADYQFGAGAGDALFSDLVTESRYPKLRVTDDEGTQLAAMVPEYGLLALTLAGARRWVDADVSTKCVTIDRFVPHGSVLAPGVVDADDDIRVGDEVVVEGPQAFGVGRAAMHGRAMVTATRGEAVDVRHVEER